MALPVGWTATVTRYELDRSYLPARLAIELLIQGADGTGFPVDSLTPIPEVLGLSQQDTVSYAWVNRMQGYTLGTIQSLQPGAVIASEPAIVGQQVQLP